MAQQPVLLATMTKGTVVTFLWLLANPSSAFAQSDCMVPFYESGVNRTCVETCPANEFGNYTSGQCEPYPPNHIVSLNATAYVSEITADTPFGTPVLYFSAVIGNPAFTNVLLTLVENALVERVFKFPNGQTSQTLVRTPNAGSNTIVTQIQYVDDPRNIRPGSDPVTLPATYGMNINLAALNPLTGTIVDRTTRAFVTIDLPQGAPRVTITRDLGFLLGGHSYNLTCNVILDSTTTGSPTIEWLGPNTNPLSNISHVTVGNMVMLNNSTYERALVFSSLHTSHGGQYACRATLGQVSATTSTAVRVQIPPPTVSVTFNRTGILYAGTPLTLTCFIQLNPAVDTTVVVARMWSGPGSQTVSNSSRITVSNLMESSGLVYETTIEFAPLNTTDSGNYKCEATVSPDPPSRLIIRSKTGRDSHSVTVQAIRAPLIDIHSGGTSTAGQPYSLSCTATVVENLVVPPRLEWLETDHDRRVVGSNNISVGIPVTTGTNTSLTFTFVPLHTSHGGKYTCRATINIPAISLLSSGETDFVVVVQIPSPTVAVTTMQPAINGTNVNLTCTITLDSSVDTKVQVSATWLKSNTVLTTSSNTTTVSDVQAVDHLTYQTLLQFEPLGNNFRNGGHYLCEATVTPFQGSLYIRNVSNNDSFFLSVAALPLPNVQFTPSTFALAGRPYFLTCTVQVVQNLGTIPTVNWLAPDGGSFQKSNDITVGKPVRNGNIITLHLTFDRLTPSHAGNYTCRACVSIDKIAIEGHCGHVVAEVTLMVSGRVQDLESMHISDRSVSVLWREPENTNGAVVSYTVQVQRYQPVSGGSRELELVAVDPEFNQSISTASLTLSNDGRFTVIVSGGLEPLVPYQVTVVAVNLAGPGEQETKVFFTSEGAPSTVPGNVEVIRINGTAINISWVPLNLVEARGFIRGYIITYQQVSNGSRHRRQAQMMQVDGSASYTLVGDIQPGVAYNVTVAGMTVQTGPVSPPTHVRPEPTSPFGVTAKLFQLQLSGLPSTCQIWVGSDVSTKLSETISAVVQNTERLCQCELSAEHLTDYAFQCFPNSDQQVTFRAKLHETTRATSSQLMEYIEQWINAGTSIAVQGVRMNVDDCPITISSFEDPQCHDETAQPTTLQTMETTFDSTPTEAALLGNVAAIVGGAVAVMVVLILAVTITIIAVAVLVTKSRKYKYSTDQDVGKQSTRWNEVAGPSTADIMTSQCKAYELVTIGQDREVVSEHEYDEIPAFVGGRQMQGQKDYEDIPVQPPVLPTLQATCGRVEEA